MDRYIIKLAIHSCQCDSLQYTQLDPRMRAAQCDVKGLVNWGLYIIAGWLKKFHCAAWPSETMKSQERWIMVAISLVISVLLIYGVCTSVAKKVVQTSPKGKAGTVVAERNLIPDGEGLVDRKGITHLANGTGIDLAAASEDSHDVAGPSEASENIVNVTHSDETLADNSLLDYSDIAFFTILTNQVGTRADDSDKLRALIGVIAFWCQYSKLLILLRVEYPSTKTRTQSKPSAPCYLYWQ